MFCLTTASRRSLRGTAGTLSAVCAILLLGSAMSSPVTAGKIAWTGQGAYETCLEGEAETWLNAKAEDVVNGEASVKKLDDAQVAAVAINVMKICAGKGAPSDAGNDAVFGKYMAHWREHLYELAKAIRAKGGSD